MSFTKTSRGLLAPRYQLMLLSLSGSPRASCFRMALCLGGLLLALGRLGRLLHFRLATYRELSLLLCVKAQRQASLFDEISSICTQGTYGIHAGSANRRNCCSDEDGREHREKDSGICDHIVRADAE
jgi:hypothetical protein